MIEFIAKYWLEVLFGLICAGVSFAVKHHYKLITEKRKDKEKSLLEKIDDKFETQTENMKAQMASCYATLSDRIEERDAKLLQADVDIHNEINVLRDGMLSVQGREFKADCRYLLQDGHTITLSEYENIVEEHRIYNSLHGNHEGDALFAMVQAKYEQTLLIKR